MPGMGVRWPWSRAKRQEGYGGSRDATWVPRPPRAAPTRGPAGRRMGGSRLVRRRRVLLGVGIAAALLAGGRADRRVVREVAAATGRGHRGPAPHGDHGRGGLPGPDLVGADARRGLPGDAVRRVRQRPVVELFVIGLVVVGGRGGQQRRPRCTSRSWRSPPATRSQRRAARRARRAADCSRWPATVPAWRDLTPGESGPDVTELQNALASLGYYDGGDTPGYFGSATEDAVARTTSISATPRRRRAACPRRTWCSCRRCQRRWSR